MNRILPGVDLAPPAAQYAHAVVSDGPSRLLHTSGVVPVAPDGTVPSTLDAQAAVVWSNIETLLDEADMTVRDVVSVITYVVVDHVDSLASVMAVRDRHLDGHLAASTLVTVPRLARREWMMEIAVVAAR
jgi:2-iminobutanoate/2-iminopropanoate deaminase